MRRVSLVPFLVALAAMAVPSPALAAECPGADLRPAQDNLQQVAEATLCLLNDARAAAGLEPLAEQAELTEASEAYSQLMVTEQFFAHVSPDGRELTDRLSDVGYLGGAGSWVVGENIAWGESYLAAPAEIVEAWMNSDGHRANILSPEYAEVGLGIATGVPTSSNAGATYTTDFGTRELADQTGGDLDEPEELTVGVTDSTTPRSGVRSGARKHKSARARRRSRARRTCRGAMAGWGASGRKPGKPSRSRCAARTKHRHR